jgi:putative transposase
VPGGCYFFTVVTHQRRQIFREAANVSLLRSAFRHIRSRHPFELEAIVVLPDHLHCLWRLPPNDSDYSSRWREIKKFVSRRLPEPERRKGIWQPRFWEHTIRDDLDWERHLDYIHFNPVKHGWVDTPHEWPWSSFHIAVKRGWYPRDWGVSIVPDVAHEPWD